MNSQCNALSYTRSMAKNMFGKKFVPVKHIPRCRWEVVIAQLQLRGASTAIQPRYPGYWPIASFVRRNWASVIVEEGGKRQLRHRAPNVRFLVWRVFKSVAGASQ